MASLSLYVLRLGIQCTDTDVSKETRALAGSASCLWIFKTPAAGSLRFVTQAGIGATLGAPTPSLERYRDRMREESLRGMLVSSCVRIGLRINLGILIVLVLSACISLEDNDADGDEERDWFLSVLLVAVVALSKEISSAAQFDSNEDNDVTDTLLLCLMVFFCVRISQGSVRIRVLSRI
jgi:hypothetical protein